jgi:hypothetical protein
VLACALAVDRLLKAIEPKGVRIRITGGLPDPNEPAPESRFHTSDELVTTSEGRRLLDEMRTRSATTLRETKPV